MPVIPVNFKCSSELRPTLIFALYETFRQMNRSTDSLDLLEDFRQAHLLVQSGHLVYLQTSCVFQFIELLHKLGVDVEELTLPLAERFPDDEEEF